MTKGGGDDSARIEEAWDYRIVEIGDDLVAEPASPPLLVDEPLAIAIS